MATGRIPSVQNASTLAGATLATNVLASSLTSFGATPTLTTPKITTYTTNGDLAYGTGASAIARLGIGSTGQVLTVAAGIPSWATVAAGGLTKIVTADFSGAASVQINNCFTSTYVNYIIVLNALGNSGGGAMFLQWQTGTNTIVSSANYYAGGLTVNNSSVLTNIANNAATKFTIGSTVATNLRQNFTINCSNVGNSSQDANLSTIGNGGGGSGVSILGGIFDGANTYTGVCLTANGNLTGTYTVYGLAK